MWGTPDCTGNASTKPPKGCLIGDTWIVGEKWYRSNQNTLGRSATDIMVVGAGGVSIRRVQ